ncbi:MAG: GNAT family N-acetyltransferase [Nitrospiraceae bacterium]
MPTSALDRLIVRPGRIADVDVLVAFSEAMALETEGRGLDIDRLRRGTRRVFDSPTRGFYVVAELPQESSPGVIGQLLVTYEWSDWRDATFWWIQSVYVHPDWRRRGVYRRMHEYVRQQARSRHDVCGLRLYVEAANSGAQAAYRQVGLFPSSYRVLEEDFVLPLKIV